MIRNIISIDDRDSISVPNGKIAMRDFEIAELFGVMVPTVKGKMSCPEIALHKKVMLWRIEEKASTSGVHRKTIR